MQQFTENAIIASFVKLLNSLPLDKITIKNIVDDCGLNRSTFYYYFEDINALLEEVFLRETLKAIEPGVDYDTWQDGILHGVEFALNNKRAIYHIYKSSAGERLSRYLYEVAGHMMLQFVKTQAVGLHVSDDDMQLISDVYKFAAVGLLLQWLEDGMKQDPAAFIQRLGRLMDGNIRTILERADVTSAKSSDI